MANICSNEVSFYASDDALNWLAGELKALMEIMDYRERCQKVEDLFSGVDSYGDTSLGSKYVYIYNYDLLDQYLNIEFESAWHCPATMIETITKMLQERSGDFPVVSDGRYWEEGVGFAGIFKCDKDGFRSAETDIDTEYDEEDEDFDFHEDILEPAFADLFIE